MCRLLWVLCALLPMLGVSAVSQSQLATRDDVFTVGGEARFLTFISYFDGLDAGVANWQKDFAWMQGKVDGIRVFPNWWAQVRPLRCDPNNTVVDLSIASPHINESIRAT